ncbi:hypothetical protein WJX74_008124 [Apatococcus lobatus]|uniref:Uncharacterized protein n=1 Tax=Apatococcus lobatus TaxID=904363 RepID=A0AAW1S3E8_9CHLO
MAEGVRRTGRNRRPAPKLDVGGDDRAREQALRKSLLEVQRVVHEAAAAPVCYPTEEEWRDFYSYIETISPLGLAHGIVKIVPPPSMRDTPDGAQFAEQMLRQPSSFPVRRQEIHRLQEGIGFDETQRYNSGDYKQAAEDAMHAWLRVQAAVSCHESGKENSSQDGIRLAEAEYWKIVERASQHEFMAEYANDLDSARHGTAFNDEVLKRWGWHLGTLADGNRSALQRIGEPIAGVTYPWLYFGMLFASFCWHNEDHFLYSINYHHAGAPKTWYGIPGKQAEKFERALRNSFPLRFLEDPDLLHLLVIQASPSLLLQQGVDVVRLVQEPGEMVVTWPKAYHCGFSHGWNCSEAINFAPFDWLPKGFEAIGRYCKMGGKRKPLFSHDRLVFELAQQAVRAAASPVDPAAAACPTPGPASTQQAAQTVGFGASNTAEHPGLRSVREKAPPASAATAPGAVVSDAQPVPDSTSKVDILQTGPTERQASTLGQESDLPQQAQQAAELAEACTRQSDCKLAQDFEGLLEVALGWTPPARPAEALPRSNLPLKRRADEADDQPRSKHQNAKRQCRGDGCNCRLPDLTNFLRSFLPSTDKTEPEQEASASDRFSSHQGPGASIPGGKAAKCAKCGNDSQTAVKRPTATPDITQPNHSQQPSASNSSGTNTSVDLPELLLHQHGGEETSAAAGLPDHRPDDSSRPCAGPQGAQTESGPRSSTDMMSNAFSPPDQTAAAPSGQDTDQQEPEQDCGQPSSPDLTPPATSASTAKMAAKDVVVLADALKQVMEEEKGWRRGILQEGATDASVPYGRANLPSLAGDNTEPACSHCATLMFLSCVTCSCSPMDPRCLAHAHIGCACSWRKKLLHIQVPVQQLEALHATLLHQLRAL